MSIHVEFYGLARRHAGIASTTADAPTLGKLVTELTREMPQLATHCFVGDALQAGYLANVNGERFVVDPATPLANGDTLLILSADAGG